MVERSLGKMKKEGSLGEEVGSTGSFTEDKPIYFVI